MRGKRNMKPKTWAGSSHRFCIAFKYPSYLHLQACSSHLNFTLRTAKADVSVDAVGIGNFSILRCHSEELIGVISSSCTFLSRNPQCSKVDLPCVVCIVNYPGQDLTVSFHSYSSSLFFHLRSHRLFSCYAICLAVSAPSKPRHQLSPRTDDSKL